MDVKLVVTCFVLLSAQAAMAKFNPLLQDKLSILAKLDLQDKLSLQEKLALQDQLDLQDKLELQDELNLQGKLDLPDMFGLQQDLQDVDEIVPVSPIRNHPKMRLPDFDRKLHSDVDKVHFDLGDLGLFLPSDSKSEHLQQQQQKQRRPKKQGSCTRQILELCDLKELAAILENPQDPCELLQAYQSCVVTELVGCVDQEAELLKASLDLLFTGFMLNGHCANPRVDLKRTLADITDLPMTCAPEETLHCARNLHAALRGAHSVCLSVHRFNHCLHRMTSSCPHSASKYLRNGGRGLNKVYRHVGLCPHRDQILSKPHHKNNFARMRID